MRGRGSADRCLHRIWSCQSEPFVQLTFLRQCRLNSHWQSARRCFCLHHSSKCDQLAGPIVARTPSRANCSNAQKRLCHKVCVCLQLFTTIQSHYSIVFRGVHDVKATSVGVNKYSFKAEIDYGGREITRAYLRENCDMKAMLEVFLCFCCSQISKSNKSE